MSPVDLVLTVALQRALDLIRKGRHDDAVRTLEVGTCAAELITARRQ